MTTHAPTPPVAKHRRWYQFSLRTLVAFVMIISVVLGLVTARHRRAQRQAAAVALLRANGGRVEYDYMWRRTDDGRLALTRSSQSSVPRWLLHAFGEDFFHEVLMARVEFDKAESQAERDKVLKAVGDLHKLEELEFFDLGFHGVPNIEPLRNLRKVRVLNVTLGRLASRDFEVFESMPELERVTLFGQHIDAEAATHLGRLRKVTFLSIDQGNEVDDAAIVELAELRRLESLFLTGTAITDKSISAIARLGELKCLWLAETPISDRGVAQLSEMKRLKDLNLTETKVTGAFVHWPPALTTVRLSRSAISDEGLRSLSRCGSLANLDLGDTQISDAGIAYLESLQKLEWLGLDRTNVSDASLRVVGRLPQLKYLSLNHTKLTDAGLQSLEGLQNLERLELAGTKVACNRLRWPAGLQLANLSHTELTDDALLRLAQCPKLEHVVVDKTQVTDEGLLRFRMARPNVDWSGPLPLNFVLVPQ